MKALVGVLVLSLICFTVADNQEEKDEQAKFFVKSYSTTTWTFLSSLTSTVPYTCYTTTNAGAAACTGRRRRRSKKLELTLDDASEMDGLTSSGDEELRASEKEGSSPQDKFFFTLWRTSSTTVTVTTFSTNRSVTVSASIFCTYQGAALQLCA